MHHGLATPALLEGYEQERRPVAEQFTRSSDAADQAQLLEGRGERDEAIAATLADPAACRQEAVAEAELNVSYAGSVFTAGPEAPPLGAGQRLPTTITLPPGAGVAHLHQLTHRLGHTLLLLAAHQADPAEIAGLRAQLEADTLACPLVEGLETTQLAGCNRLSGPPQPSGGATRRLLGLRADTDHREAPGRYRQLVLGR